MAVNRFRRLRDVGGAIWTFSCLAAVAYLASARPVAAQVVPYWSLDNATKTVFTDLFSSGYDPSTRPTFGGGADKVYVQFKLNSLYDIDPLSSTFTVDCDLRLSWIDDRLIFDPEQYPIPNTTDLRALGHASLGNGYGAPHLVWTPDVYFENEVEPTIHNEVIKLIPGTGEVSYRRHFLSRLTTNFTFQSFPFDAQWLPLSVTPYSYNDKQIELYFLPSPVFPEPTSQTFGHSSWDFQTYKVRRELYQSRNDQPFYDRVVLEILVSRKSDSYLIKSILPLILLVGLSCINFWFSVEAVPERLGLVVTLVLTIVSFYSTVTSSLPAVNYPTTLDYYVTMAFILTFEGLVEIALVHHLVVRKGDVLLATEIDYFHRRTVLIVWGIFNLILIKAGIWLGILVGAMIFAVIFWNLWILYFRVSKRRQKMFDPQATQTAGKSLAEQRKAYDKQLNWGIQATEKMYNILHMQVPVSDEELAMKALAAHIEAENRALEELIQNAESGGAKEISEEAKEVLTKATLSRKSVAGTTQKEANMATAAASAVAAVPSSVSSEDSGPGTLTGNGKV